MKLDSTTESMAAVYQAKEAMYTGLNTLSKTGKLGNFAVRMLGLPVGLASSVMHVAGAVANFFESAFKGIINMAGSPFSAKYSFKQGVKQLFVETPINLLRVAVSPLHFLTTLEKTIGFLVNPEKNTNSHINFNKHLLNLTKNDKKTTDEPKESFITRIGKIITSLQINKKQHNPTT